MSLRRSLQPNRDAEADRSSPRVDDRSPAYTLNVKMAPTHTLPGCDSVREPDETKSLLRLTETLSLAETSKVTTPSPIYSKRPSGNSRWPTSHLRETISILSDLC
jgi:hypothetical protein